MSKASALSARVLEHLERRGTEATRRWSMAYLKNSTPFFGCKMPAVRECVRIAVEEEEEKKPNKKRARLEDSETVGMATSYVSDAIALLRHEYGESKQAGSILLCEHTPPHVLGSVATLERLEREVIARLLLRAHSQPELQMVCGLHHHRSEERGRTPVDVLHSLELSTSIASTARIAASSSECPESMMRTIPGCRLWAWSSTSAPLMPGMRMSVTITSNSA